jgi:hypothetical protein
MQIILNCELTFLLEYVLRLKKNGQRDFGLTGRFVVNGIDDVFWNYFGCILR